MKKLSVPTVLFIIVLALSAFKSFSQDQSPASKLSVDSPKKGAAFGSIASGYSNLGLFARAGLYYRKANFFAGAGYYKSHICFLDIDKGEYSPDTKASDTHVTVQTFSASFGIVTHRILFLSCGLAYSLFDYEHTLPMTDIISPESVWLTALGKNYGETVLSEGRMTAVGVPLEARVNFSPSRFVGISTGVMVYLNTEQTICAAEIGVRFGKATRK